MTRRPLSPAASDAILKARARRLEAQGQADTAAQRAAGRHDCGLSTADCERIGACKASRKREALKLFGGL